MSTENAPIAAIPDRATVEIPVALLFHDKISANALRIWLAGRALADATNAFVDVAQLEEAACINRDARRTAMRELEACGLASFTVKGGKKCASFWRFAPFDDRQIDGHEMRKRAGMVTLSTATQLLTKEGKQSQLLTIAEVAHVTKRLRASSVTLCKPQSPSTGKTSMESPDRRGTPSTGNTSIKDIDIVSVSHDPKGSFDTDIADDSASRGERHALIIDAWCKSFEAAQGVKYEFAGGRDGKAAKELAKMPYAVETFAAMFRAVFDAAKKRPGFNTRSAATSLLFMQARWNGVVVELGDVARSILGGVAPVGSFDMNTEEGWKSYASSVGADPRGVRFLKPKPKTENE